MANILFITPGPIEWVSSRIRAHWVAEHIEGSKVVDYNHDKFYPNQDIYIFIKVTDTEHAKLAKAAGAKVFLDICDPVHWFSPSKAKEMADVVDGIVASNQGLADDFSEWSGKDVTVIPDRLKLSHFKPRMSISTDPPVRFIWYGASQNRFSVMSAFAYLERIKANGVEISLTICDDNPNQVYRFDNFPIYHVAWKLEHESEIISAHDIAILPPYPGPWGKVKSKNKDVTAAACGVVPTTGEDWNELFKLAANPRYRMEKAQDNLETVKKEYNVEQSAAEWKELLK